MQPPGSTSWWFVVGSESVVPNADRDDYVSRPADHIAVFGLVDAFLGQQLGAVYFSTRGRAWQRGRL